MTRRRLLGASSTALAGLWLGAGCSARVDTDTVSTEARALHRDSLVLDLHVDSLLWTRLFDYDLTRRHSNRFPLSPFGFHVDLPRAREGGLDGAVMGLVINPKTVRDELMLPLEALAWWEDQHGARQVETTLTLLADAAAAHPDELVFARTGSEVKHAVAQGRFVAFAGLEGAQGIEGDLSHVTDAHALGLRMLGLVHFQTTAAGHPMTVAAHSGRGLSPFGRELISELERLSIVVDLAHLNRAGVSDALAMMRRPCVVSHSGCAAVHPHPRNLSDDQLRAIGNAGGIVGIAFGRSFLGGARDLDALLDHFEHAIRVAGPDAVALGSDYDGFIIPAVGMGDARAYPLVTEGLLRRGRSPQNIQKALGLNALRVLTEVCG